MRTQNKYGSGWPIEADDLQIELAMIARGGKSDAYPQALPLFDHFMEARRMLWPKRYRHRWTNLLYEEFIKNDITILMGAASTQKTSHASEFVLINYFARSENTLVILSTITVEKLNTGVFGEVKMLWQQAKDRFDWIPGNLLEGNRAITTDNIEEDGVRDMRKGIKGVPCFPSGTLVDTIEGKRPIESIKYGDCVINADGVGVVIGTHMRFANSLVRIKISDERIIDCTPEHPILTQRGWIKAVDLETFDEVLSVYETLRLLRKKKPSIPEPKVLPPLPPSASNSVRVLQAALSAPKTKSNQDPNGKILQYGLRRSLGIENSNKTCSHHMQTLWKEDHGTFSKRILLKGLPETIRTPSLRILRKGVCFKNRIPKEAQESFLFLALSSERDATASEKNWRIANARGIVGLENVSKFNLELFGKNWTQKDRWEKSLVQSGHRFSENKVGDRNRWKNSSPSTLRETGQNKNQHPEKPWVVSIEILKQKGDARFNKREGGYQVHNLEVDGHPSYSVNGVIVHNCYVGKQWVGLGILAGTKQDYIFYVCDEIQFMQPTFISSWPNIFSNGEVKIIGSGNPKHDPDDQLGIAAEPKQGWSSIGVPEKTQTWDTQFLNGRCVNLVGTDSPNFDTETDRFPKLIGRKFVARIENDWGKDSPEYYSQVKGVMRIDLAQARVITRQLCREHRAMETAIWKDDLRTKVFGLDPTYGGGDRCIGIPGEFGDGLDIKSLLKVHPWLECRINLSLDKKPEDQIADWLAETLQALGIPVENCFYDSTGKGTLGFAFARKFGEKSPVPVDSGGLCTMRPVREGLFITDDHTKNTRPKTCREHYSKFVSEMWFSVRYAIEANQMRELPEDVMLEGCARVYEMVAGNKIQVEPKSDPRKKEDLKRRLGKSPDLFDALAIMVEGARQRGFVIASLGPVSEFDDADDDFYAKEAREYQEAIKQQLLDHSV